MKNATILLMVGSPAPGEHGEENVRWSDPAYRQFWGIALPRFLAEPAWGTLTRGSRCSCLKFTALT